MKLAISRLKLAECGVHAITRKGSHNALTSSAGARIQNRQARAWRRSSLKPAQPRAATPE